MGSTGFARPGGPGGLAGLAGVTGVAGVAVPGLRPGRPAGGSGGGPAQGSGMSCSPVLAGEALGAVGVGHPVMTSAFTCPATPAPARADVVVSTAGSPARPRG